MADMVILHSMLSGKGTPEEKKSAMTKLVESATGIKDPVGSGVLIFCSCMEDILSSIEKLLNDKTPKVALCGGDGFASLYFNKFYRMRAEHGSQDYSPDILFIPGGTGNAVSYCTDFKDSHEALKLFVAGEYMIKDVNLLDVHYGNKKELTQFVSFGADGEVLEIYRAQKLKGLWGYIWAVLKYCFGRKLYNPFSRNDANYNLTLVKNGEKIHEGRHEGGGVSAIPYLGYGFKAFPLAVGGRAQVRMMIFGAILMPTIFKFTNWTFVNKPNRFIYDNEVHTPSVLDFSFDRELHVQLSGDCDPNVKHTSVRVECSGENTIKMASRKA